MVLSSYVARFCAAAPLLGLLAASCQAAPVPETVGPTLKTITTPHGNVTGEISASSSLSCASLSAARLTHQRRRLCHEVHRAVRCPAGRHAALVCGA